jgi:hypothetical protein
LASNPLRRGTLFRRKTRRNKYACISCLFVCLLVLCIIQLMYQFNPPFLNFVRGMGKLCMHHVKMIQNDRNIRLSCNESLQLILCMIFALLNRKIISIIRMCLLLISSTALLPRTNSSGYKNYSTRTLPGLSSLERSCLKSFTRTPREELLLKPRVQYGTIYHIIYLIE